VGVSLLGQQRRPEPRVTRAHDAQVGSEIANQRRVRLRFEGIGVQPPQFGLYFSQVA